jgi:streptogramin lyase
MDSGIRALRRLAMLSASLVLAILAAASAAQATAIKEFRLPAGSDPRGITPGPGLALWFTDDGSTHAIGRITSKGDIKEFTKGFTSNGSPSDITLGPDGNMWFTADGSPPNAIGKVTTGGAIKEFVAGTHGLNLGAAPSNITVGPDGNLWFLDDGSPKAIGRVTPKGVIKEFTLSDPINSNLEDLTAGPDGNMWFTDRGDTRAIGRVTPKGTITEFTGTLDQMNSMPNGITSANGKLWFTDEGSPGALGRFTPKGQKGPKEFTSGLQTSAVPDAITTGSDGNVWFEDNLGGDEAIGRITPSGAIKEFSNHLHASPQDDITLGADGNVWVEQSMPGGIARITPSGTITQFKKGLLAGAGSDGDQLVSGPDGNLWFTDRGADAIGRVALQLPPAARTGPAGDVSGSSATVFGFVNPLGSATKVRFQYGRTPALGSSVGAGTLRTSGDTAKVKARLSGLSAGATIFYRVVATNAFGARRGAIKSFKT